MDDNRSLAGRAVGGVTGSRSNRAISADGPAEEQYGQVKSRLVKIETALTDCEDEISRLEENLQPILKPVSALKSGEGTSSPKEALCPLADKLETMYQMLRVTKERLHELNCRVDI